MDRLEETDIKYMDDIENISFKVKNQLLLLGIGGEDERII